MLSILLTYNLRTAEQQYDPALEILLITTEPEIHDQLAGFQIKEGIQPISWEKKKELIRQIIESNNLNFQQSSMQRGEPLRSAIGHLDVPFASYLKSKGAKLVAYTDPGFREVYYGLLSKNYNKIN